MVKLLFNPINIHYAHQYDPSAVSGGKVRLWREHADPSLILYRGKYYMFVSMSPDVLVSEDLSHWENHPLPSYLPLTDYAPDVRVIGEYVWYCASRYSEACSRFRTQDILNGPYEEFSSGIPFWDPNVFADDDGRIYFYSGCSNTDPIRGVELDPVTMRPIGEFQNLIFGRPGEIGYERRGEDHERGRTDAPYIEGAWMTKHNGKYYLQYAAPGTQWNIYADGVYVSDHPLGPFHLQKNNPFSYHPGGFLPGAGHGSTLCDRNGNWFHTATMRISSEHMFERRIGLWPAGFDADGELFCNQRYGDWPHLAPEEHASYDPWANPPWMLLSAHAEANASSCLSGHPADCITDENVCTWWRPQTAECGEWVQVDLGAVCTVYAIQVNFGDDHTVIPVPEAVAYAGAPRVLLNSREKTQWKLLGSEDGVQWTVLEDRSAADTDLSHDMVCCPDGIRLRYLRLTDISVPFGLLPCVSGIRAFGKSEEALPETPTFCAVRTGDTDMEVTLPAPETSGAVGYEILWGYAPDKLYHDYLTYKDHQTIGALICGEEVYVRVDAWNRAGITEGITVHLS